MHLIERAHVYHRVWRYRLRTERQEIAYLRSRNLRDAVVADVGANRGVYSYWMHKAVAPHGCVVAFEPQPELAAYIHDISTAFHLDRLTIVESALSSHVGERRLVRPRQFWASASLELEPDGDADCFNVPTTTLDDYFQGSDLRPLRFIKADIQGHEYDCFVGGEQTLKQDRPEILCECLDPEFDKVNAYLASLDYSGFFFCKNRLTPVSQLKQLRSTIPARYLNYVFVPAELAKAG
jgi:FkbM family methyltransferase